jgi:hypothetical protein
MMRYQSDFAIAAVYLGVISGLFLTLTVAERRNWKADLSSSSKAAVELPDTLRRLGDNKWLRNLPLATITAVVSGFMLLGALSVQGIPPDFGAVASVLAALMLAQMVRGQAATGSVIMRGALYATAAFSAYLLVTYPGSGGEITHRLADFMMFVLAVSLGIFIRFLSERKFSITPTDFLVAFGLVALVLFDRAGGAANTMAQFVTYAILLFYGCEVISERIASRWHLLNWAALATLTIAGVRGLSGA